MPVTTNCPRCRRSLQVPDELQGQPLQCPACREIFLPESGMSSVAAVPASEAGPEFQPHTDSIGQNARARRLVLGPAIGLIVIGAIGMGLNLIDVYGWLAHRER